LIKKIKRHGASHDGGPAYPVGGRVIKVALSFVPVGNQTGDNLKHWIQIGHKGRVTEITQEYVRIRWDGMPRCWREMDGGGPENPCFCNCYALSEAFFCLQPIDGK
jgi:hypothetical protein